MKKFLATAFFILAMLNCSSATSYETSSPYWSTSKVGPTSMNQAIEMLFKDRKDFSDMNFICKERNQLVLGIVL